MKGTKGKLPYGKRGMPQPTRVKPSCPKCWTKAMVAKAEAAAAAPVFTHEELQALHYDERTASYSPEKHYDARRSAVKKLDAYFGDDTSHLKGKTK